jgi:hypothetical protein
MPKTSGPQAIMQADSKPTESELLRQFMTETIADLIGLNVPRLRGQVRVLYKSRCPFHWAAQRSQKYGIILICSLKMSDQRFLAKIKRASEACLEVHEGRTKAIAVRQRKAQ